MPINVIPPVFTGGSPFFEQVNTRALEALRDRGIYDVGGGLTADVVPGKGVRLSLRRPLELDTRANNPFELIRIYDDGGFKAIVAPGTFNGSTPVVGDVEGSGRTALSLTNPVPLNTGKPYVCIGVKTNLETRIITRLTVQTREDIVPIVDTGARTRIAFIPIFILTESVDPAGWSLSSQVATTHLLYFTAGNSDFTWRT
jgi:hypothetical protein